MGATNSDKKSIKFFSLFGKSSAEEKPCFKLSEKVNGAWTNTAKFDTLIGSLTYAAIEQKEWQGVKFNVFVIKLSDGEEVMQVEMKHTSATHSVINSLCSINYNSLEDLYIRLYQTVKGDKYYAGAQVKFGANDLKWKFPFTDVPQKVAVMLPGGEPFMQMGKQVYDDTLQRKFWEDKFTEHVIKQVGMAGHATPSAPYSAPMSPNAGFDDVSARAQEVRNQATQPSQNQADIQDLPF
jgi:hypothetical protein